MGLGVSGALAKYGKWIVRAAEYAIPAGFAWLESELISNEAAPAGHEWRRFQQTWTRTTPTGTAEDRAQFKLDIVNITGDDFDATWDAGDFTVVSGAFAAFRTALNAQFGANQQWSDLKAYRMTWNPVPDILYPFADTGPPVYVEPHATSMGGSAHMPYQVAITTTHRTAWARHWGRAYLPTPADGTLDGNGRWRPELRDPVQAAMKTLMSTCADAELYPVIPTSAVNKTPFHALLGITSVYVDDIPDIQRRRRPRQVAARSGP